MNKNTQMIVVASVAGVVLLIATGVRAQPPHGTNAVAQVKLAPLSYPAIDYAIVALGGAKQEIGAATTDFEGHRVETIEQIDRMVAKLKSLTPDTNAVPVMPGRPDEPHLAYPAIRKAITSLGMAKGEIASADNNFGQQRDAVLEQIDRMTVSLKYLLQDAPNH